VYRKVLKVNLNLTYYSLLCPAHLSSSTMGFTFDSPISITTNAYEKAHRHRRAPSCPVPAKRSRHSPVFMSISSHVLLPLKKSVVPAPSRKAYHLTQRKPATLAKDSTFFRLPLKVREKIYGVSASLFDNERGVRSLLPFPCSECLDPSRSCSASTHCIT